MAIDPALAFDAATETELRNRPSAKWTYYDADVLPLWVADMDFEVAAPIREALRHYVDHGSYGYPPRGGLPGLVPAVADRLATRFGWTVEDEDVHVVAGVLPGVVLGILATTSPDDHVILQPPVYPPFYKAIAETKRQVLENPLVNGADGYGLDIEGLRAAITPTTRTLLLCNPHNPTGRMFTRAELEALAEVVLEHDLWVISDEVHADLALEGTHVPFASLSPEAAQRTLTVYGPTKAFSLAGLGVSFVISQNPELLARAQAQRTHATPGPNVFGQVAALAAYRHADAWREAAIEYIRANRDHLLQRLRDEAPTVKAHPAQGTYLMWLDFRDTGLDDDPAAALLSLGRVALNPGPSFGTGGAGFARLNLATSRRTLDAAIDRIMHVVGIG